MKTSELWWRRKKLKAKTLCNRTKSSLSAEMNKNDGNLLKAFHVLWWFIIKSHEKNYGDSQDICFIVWSPWTAPKSSWIPKILMFSGWLNIFSEKIDAGGTYQPFRLPPVKTFRSQASCVVWEVCCEKSTHGSIVRLCCTRNCLHWKKTRSNSVGI